MRTMKRESCAGEDSDSDGEHSTPQTMQLDSFTTPQLAALGVLLAYFTLIIGLFVLIFRSLLSLKNNVTSRLGATFPYAFTFLTVASFGHTWYCE